MKPNPATNLSYRRMGIFLHIIVVSGLSFYFIVNPEAPGLTTRLSFLGVMILIILATFKSFFWNTGLWQLTHRSRKKLDERELMEVSGAVQISYSVFAILTVVIFYVLSILEKRFLIPLAACFLYLAHILPSCILGWKLKNI